LPQRGSRPSRSADAIRPFSNASASQPSVADDEIASILLAWLTFYGSALAAAKRSHIGCPEVVALLPPVARLAARLLADALVIAFFVLLGWTGYTVLGVLATDHLVSLPDVPVAYVQSVIPISAVLIIAAELMTLPQALRDALAAH